MAKRKHKRNNAKENINVISSVKIIDREIMTQAIIDAYRAIEKEKNMEVQEEHHKQVNKEKWYVNVFFMLNVIFLPWKINKKFKVNNSIYDSILVIFVSVFLSLFGAVIWMAGFAMLISSLVLVKGTSIGVIVAMMGIAVIVMMIGSMFVLSANEFSKVSDRNIIYAYSANVIALISCFVAVLALVGDCF